MLYTIRANVIIDGKQLGSSYAKAHHHPTTNTGPFTAGPINQTLWLSGSVLSRRTLTGRMTDKVSFSQLPIMAATRTRPKSLFLYLSLG